MVYADRLFTALASLPGIRRGVDWLWREGPDGQTIPNYRWVVMVLWNTCSISSWMLPSTIGILLPAISADLDLSSGQQGLLSSAAFWGGLALGIPMAWWFSKYPVKLVTTVTLALGAGFFFLQGWAPVFTVLLAGRLLFGISRLAADPARAMLTRQWFADREIILSQSVGNALFGLIVGGGFLFTPIILSSLGNDWRMTLNIYGAVFAVLTILWWLLGKERPTAAERLRPEVPGEAGGLVGALMYRDLWLAGLGFLGVATAMGAFLSFFPTLMLEDYGVSIKWSGGLLALSTFIGGVSGLAIGYAVFITGNRNAVLAFVGVLMAGSYAGMTLTGWLPLLLALAVINGATWGFWPVLSTVPYLLPGIRAREAAVATTLTMTATSGGMVLGPLIAGYIDEAVEDLKITLMVVSLAPLALTAIGLLLRSNSGTGVRDRRLN